MNASFYEPGGPAFLMIGGEGPANPIWMVQGSWIDYAKKHKAICFQLEHRFYGESHPTEGTWSMSSLHKGTQQIVKVHNF